MLEEAEPSGLVLLGPFADAENLPVAVAVNRNGHQQRDITDLAGPRALEDDPVEVEVRMLARDRPFPPGRNLGVNLLIEVGDRPRAYPRTPQGFGDVLHPPDRHTGKVHLHQGFLDRSLAPPVALDNGRLERLAAQLRDFQGHLARLGVKLPLVAPGPGVPEGLRALVAFRIAQPVRLGVQQRIQRLLHAAAHDLPQVILDAIVVNPDNVRQRLRAIFLHGGSFVLGPLIPQNQPNQIRGHQPNKCAKNFLRYRKVGRTHCLNLLGKGRRW